MDTTYMSPDPPIQLSAAGGGAISEPKLLDVVRRAVSHFNYLETDEWEHIQKVASSAQTAELDFNGSSIFQIEQQDQYEVACTLSVGFQGNDSSSWTEAYPAIAYVILNGPRSFVSGVKSDLRSLQADHRSVNR